MGHQYRQTPDISMTDDDSDDEGGNSGRNGNNMTNVSNDHAINRTSPTRGADATETMDYTQSPPLNEKYFTDDEDMEIDGKQEKQFYTSEQTSSHHHNDDNIGEHTDENKNIEKHNLQEHSQRCIEELIGQNEHTRKLKYSSDQDRSDQNILAQNIKQANSNETDILASMSELSSICGQLRHLGKDRPKRTKTRPPTRAMVRVDQLEKDHDVSDETDMSRHTKHVPQVDESMKTMLTGSSTNMADRQTRHSPSPEESKGTMHTGSSTSNMTNRHTMQSSLLEEFRRKIDTGISNSNKVTNRHTMHSSPLEDSSGIMNTGSSTNNMADRQAKHVPPSNESMKTMHTGSSTNNIVDRQTRHSPPPEESRKSMHTGSSTSNMNNRHTMQSSLLEEFKRKIDTGSSNSNKITNRHTMYSSPSEDSTGIMNTGSSTNNMADRQAKHVPPSNESMKTMHTGSSTNNIVDRQTRHIPPPEESRKTMHTGSSTSNMTNRNTMQSSLSEEFRRKVQTGSSNSNKMTNRHTMYSSPLEESRGTMNTGSSTNNITDRQAKHVPSSDESMRTINTGSTTNNMTERHAKHSPPLDESKETMNSGCDTNNLSDRQTNHSSLLEESGRTMNTGSNTNTPTDKQNKNSTPIVEARRSIHTGSSNNNNITDRHTMHVPPSEESTRTMNTGGTTNNTTDLQNRHSSPLEESRKTMYTGSIFSNNITNKHTTHSSPLDLARKTMHTESSTNNMVDRHTRQSPALDESSKANTRHSTSSNTIESSTKHHPPLEESRPSMNTERSTNNNITNRFAKNIQGHRASGRDHSPGDDVNYNANSAGKQDVIRSPLSSYNTGFHSPRSPTNASSEEQPSLYPKLPLDDPTPMPEMKSITQQKLDGSNTDHINMQKSLNKHHDHLKTDNGINVREQTAVTGGSRTPQQKDENHNDVNDQHYRYQPSKSSEKVSDWRKDQWKTDYKSSEKPTSKLTKDFTSEDSQTSCDEEQTYYKKHISKTSEDNENNKSEQNQSKCKDKNISLKSKPQFSSMDLISVLAKSSNFEESLSNLAENHDISPKALRKIVSDCPQILSINQDIVELKPDATICSEHNSDRCSRRKLCPDLHICQKYLNGSCKSKMCQLGHRWDTGHNTAILGSLSISQMSSDLLTKLFFPPSSDNFLGVCKDYNNNKCLKKPCDSLHICFEVVRAVYCKLKACSLNHDIFYPSCVALLTAKGITTNESPIDIIELIKENIKDLTNDSDDESDVGKTSNTRRNQSAIQNNSKIEYDRRDNEHKDRGVNYSAKYANYDDSTDSDNIESNGIRNQSVIQKRPQIKKRDYSNDYKLKNKSIGNFELEDDRDDDGNDDKKSIYISNKPIVQRSTQIGKNSYRDDTGYENRFEVYEDEDDDNDDRDSIKKYDQIKNVGYSHNIENEKKGGGYLAGGTDDTSDNFPSDYARNQSAHLMSGQHTTSGHRHNSESKNKNVTFPVNNSGSPGNLSYENNEGNINNTSHSFRKEQQDYTADSSYQEEFKPHKTTVWAKFPSGNVDIDEICYHSVEGICPFEATGCKRLHATKHFHWQIRKSMNWYNLTHQQAISLEHAYCDPQNDDHFLEKLDSSAPEIIGSELLNVLGNDKWQANFIEMTATNDSKNGRPHRLRRLCSEYINLKQVSSNTFMWYFVDANNKCVPYGEVDTTGRAFLKTQVTSKEIDMQYRQYSQFATKNTMIFENSMFSYVIDFDKMTQTNMSTKVSRKVKRRPTLDKKITKNQGMVEKVSKSLYDFVTRPY